MIHIKLSCLLHGRKTGRRASVAKEEPEKEKEESGDEVKVESGDDEQKTPEKDKGPRFVPSPPDPEASSSNAEQPQAGAGMTIKSSAATLTDEDLKEVFPEGLTTPEALCCRLSAYVGRASLGRNPRDWLTWAVSVRDDPQYASGKGHRRAGWIAVVAIMAHIVKIKGKRDLTEKMEAMIEKTFPAEYCLKLAQLLAENWDGSVTWGKEGYSQKIGVPKRFETDGPILSWISSPWPPSSSKSRR